MDSLKPAQTQSRRSKSLFASPPTPGARPDIGCLYKAAMRALSKDTRAGKYVFYAG